MGEVRLGQLTDVFHGQLRQGDHCLPEGMVQGTVHPDMPEFQRFPQIIVLL